MGCYNSLILPIHFTKDVVSITFSTSECIGTAYGIENHTIRYSACYSTTTLLMLAPLM